MRIAVAEKMKGDKSGVHRGSTWFPTAVPKINFESTENMFFSSKKEEQQFVDFFENERDKPTILTNPKQRSDANRTPVVHNMPHIIIPPFPFLIKSILSPRFETLGVNFLDICYPKQNLGSRSSSFHREDFIVVVQQHRRESQRTIKQNHTFLGWERPALLCFARSVCLSPNHHVSFTKKLDFHWAEIN